MYLGQQTASKAAAPVKDIVGTRYITWGGDWGVGQVVGHLVRLVHESSGHSIVLDAIHIFSAGVSGSNPSGYITALSNWLPRRFTFLPDTRNVETITAPRIHCDRLVNRGETRGDCDDYAGLSAALLRGCGVRCRFVTVATGKYGKAFDHIRTDAHDGKKWISMDPFPVRNISPTRQGAWEI